MRMYGPPKLMFAAAIAFAALPRPAPAAAVGVQPFTAHYEAFWRSIAVGTSDLRLVSDTSPDHYVYTWTITARGIFRLVYRDPVTQKSWFAIDKNQVQPLRYHGDDGSSAVDLDFDWTKSRVRGTSEGKPVDLPLVEGTQDVMSIQIEIMLALAQGTLPTKFQILDKDEIKEFDYSMEGAARIRTDLGALDTIVVASRRAGSNRILRMWFAPSLGFAPVQAERTREGSLEFAMRIKSLRR